MYPALVTIHGMSMLGAFTALLMAEILLLVARRDVHRAAQSALVISQLSGALIVIGLAAGIAILFLGGWSLLTPWLLVSFALIALVIAIDSLLVGPWQAKLRPALRQRLPVGGLAGDNKALIARLGMIAVFAGIILLMQHKPDIF